MNGQASCWKDVMSRVPQGSVLDPLLFVLFINDLPKITRHNNEVYLYADDTKLNNRIGSDEDSCGLQRDLEELKRWSEKWMLNFHPDKTKHMRIGRSDTEAPDYKMFNNITKTSTEKDIGIVTGEKLIFSDHLAEKMNKVTKLVGLIRGTYAHLDPQVFNGLYTAIVRPHIEYANQIWCPYFVKDKEAIENVQRRAPKLVPGVKDLSYEERIRG